MGAHDESISVKDYARLCELIYAQAGIHLGTERKTMLEVRIKRRLKVLDLHSYSEYCNFLFSPAGLKDELIHLIDVVTTNKTDFFREPGHFDFLAEKALPELSERTAGRQFCDLERGLLDRRRAVHHGHCAERVRGGPSRLPFPHPGQRHLQHCFI